MLPHKQDADDLNNDLKSDLKNEERTSRGESEFSEWWEEYVFTLKLSTYTEWCIWSRTSLVDIEIRVALQYRVRLQI